MTGTLLALEGDVPVDHGVKPRTVRGITGLHPFPPGMEVGIAGIVAGGMSSVRGSRLFHDIGLASLHVGSGMRRSSRLRV